MLGFLIRLIVNMLVVWITSVVVGIELRGIEGVLITAVILGVVNAFIRPILFILTLPLTLLTLGLFTFVLNALMFWLALMIVSSLGFAVMPGFGTVFLGAIVMSIVSWLLSWFVH